MTRLFFYGTLMSDDRRGHVLRGLARPVCAATIPGQLFNVGFFPAYVPGDGNVHGEVWEIEPGCEAEALAITDSIEGYRKGDPFSMYVREEVEATPVGAPASWTVFTYRWNHPLDRLDRIPSGSWRRFRDAA